MRQLRNGPQRINLFSKFNYFQVHLGDFEPLVRRLFPQFYSSQSAMFLIQPRKTNLGGTQYEEW